MGVPYHRGAKFWHSNYGDAAYLTEQASVEQRLGDNSSFSQPGFWNSARAIITVIEPGPGSQSYTARYIIRPLRLPGDEELAQSQLDNVELKDTNADSITESDLVVMKQQLSRVIAAQAKSEGHQDRDEGDLFGLVVCRVLVDGDKEDGESLDRRLDAAPASAWHAGWCPRDVDGVTRGGQWIRFSDLPQPRLTERKVGISIAYRARIDSQSRHGGSSASEVGPNSRDGTTAHDTSSGAAATTKVGRTACTWIAEHIIQNGITLGLLEEYLEKEAGLFGYGEMLGGE